MFRIILKPIKRSTNFRHISTSINKIKDPGGCGGDCDCGAGNGNHMTKLIQDPGGDCGGDCDCGAGNGFHKLLQMIKK